MAITAILKHDGRKSFRRVKVAILYCYRCSKHKDESLFEANKSSKRLQCKSCQERIKKIIKTNKQNHQIKNSKSQKEHYKNDSGYKYFKKIGVIE